MIDRDASVAELERLRRQVADLLASNADLARRLAQAEIAKQLLDARLQQARVRYESLDQSRECQERMLALIGSLAPMRAQNFPKRRIGRDGDGGYVVLDDLDNIRAVMTVGVGSDVSRELELAERGADIFLFDHTVARPPQDNPKFHFVRQKVVGRAGGAGLNLNEIISRHGVEGRCLLNIDIEGDEWDVLDAASADLLAWCCQLTVEFHDFSRCASEKFWSRATNVFAKLAQGFQVVHLHGNNSSGYSLVGNVPWPDVVEVTFANRNRYTFLPDEAVYPTPLDRPNDPRAADLILTRFF